MNNISKLLAIGAISATAGLVSCGVSEDERFVELSEVHIERSVLLMDFTGQRCTNCPEAHEVMDELSKEYGDSLVCVSVHAGALSMPIYATNFEQNRIGLMIEAGQQLNDAFGINSWPMGVVNQMNIANAGQTFDQWASSVRNIIQSPADVTVRAEVKLTGDDINIDTHISSAIDRDCALQIWIVEDGIKAQQAFTDHTDSEYIHNNVLRDVKYPLAGEPISLVANTPISKSTTITCKYTDKERWEKNNLSVVAFVFQGSNILEVTKVPVVPKAE